MGKHETETIPITQPTCIPPQVDYRANPNTGQLVTTEHGQDARDNPYDHASLVAPQPNIGERGYSLNSLESPPNHMTPGPGSQALNFGQQSNQEPGDLDSIQQWDFWST